MIQNLFEIAIVFPFIWIIVDKSQKNWKKSVCILIIYYLLYSLILIEGNRFNLFNLAWNWIGKILAILFSLLFYFRYKRLFLNNQYVNLSPDKKNLKSSIIILTFLAILSSLGGLSLNKQEWSTETVLFQLTMPGFDEEIAYRGVLLGLLTSISLPKLTFKIITINNPSIYVIGLLFGLIHAIHLDTSYLITFDFGPFLQTFIIGTLYSYMAVKTQSILLPIISHNLSNTLLSLISMLK
jgi:hypothetical protein